MSKKKNEATRRPYETPTITKLDPSDPRAVALRAELEPGEPTPTTGLVVVDHLEETEALRELLERRERELELVRGQFEAARSFLHENAVDLYLRANVLYLRAHDLPVAACCELGDVLEEIRHHLGAVGLFTRCARCGYERGEHAAEAPHAIAGECAGWESP